MANIITVTCPHCGETIEIEAPVVEKRSRGQLAGIALEDMTDEQLKREIINANSVYYKAKQRGAAEDIIAANKARVDAAKAEKAKRQPVPETVEADNVAEALEADVTVDTETAEEI